jgi:hypothetical protein
MILETTQLLNNALAKHDNNYDPIYRLTHKNHPASIWAGESQSNFDWLLNLGLNLCSEYTFRYQKIHKCQSILENFSNISSRNKLPLGDMTTFRLCMPEAYHHPNPIHAYRTYYRQDKAYIAKWTKRNLPEWWDNEIYRR